LSSGTVWVNRYVSWYHTIRSLSPSPAWTLAKPSAPTRLHRTVSLKAFTFAFVAALLRCKGRRLTVCSLKHGRKRSQPATHLDGLYTRELTRGWLYATARRFLHRGAHDLAFEARGILRALALLVGGHHRLRFRGLIRRWLRFKLIVAGECGGHCKQFVL
jgi:hypothetical protein